MVSGTITAKPLSISGTSVTKVYDGDTTATSGEVSVGTVSGKVGSENVTVSGTGTFAGDTVGTHNVSLVYSLSGDDAANYSLASEVVSGMITAKPLSISGTSVTKVYDGDTTATSDEVSVGTVSGKVGSENVTVSGAGTFAGDTVGTHNVSLVYSLSGDDAANYSLASEVVSGAITAKPLTVSGSSASKVYDGDTTATSGEVSVGTVSGKVGVEEVTVSGTGTFASATVGTHDVSLVYSLSGADAGNYSAPANETVSNGGVISVLGLTQSGASAANKMYDGTTGATISGGSLSGVVGADTVSVSSSGVFSDKNVGSGKTVTLALTGSDASNYTISNGGTTTANITAKTANITGTTASNKTYDAATSASLSSDGTITAGDIESGDDLSLSSASGVFADKHVGSGKTVTVSYTLGGADASNYVASGNAVTADITAKTANITGTAASNKTYDAATSASLSANGTITAGDIESGDDLSLSSASGVFADKNVGSGKTVTVSYTLGGADAGNYVASGNAVTADITAKPLSISGTSVTKVYDGDTSAGTGSIGSESGYIGSEGDNITAAISSVGTYAGSSAGLHNVTVSYSLSGSGSDNYSLASEVVSGTITAKPLTISLAHRQPRSMMEILQRQVVKCRWVQSVVRWVLKK